jgi:hypothetical protein
MSRHDWANARITDVSANLIDTPLKATATQVRPDISSIWSNN